LSRRDGAKICTISDFQKEKYLLRQDWTAQISLNLLTKSVFTRTRFTTPKAHGEFAPVVEAAIDRFG
jgi:hypothetical protein